jgi:hypothetical protein
MRPSAFALASAVLGAVGVTTLAPACGGSGSASGPRDASTEAAVLPLTTCRDAPPAGFKPPTLPTYAGTCPMLATTPAGSTMGFVPPENDITSSGAARQFKIVTPQDIKPGEKLPIVFLWFWLGGKAQDFIDKGAIVDAAQQQRFIAIVPEAKTTASGSSAYTFKWPFSALDSQASLDAEFVFFDDLLACVSQQFADNVNPSCISSAGVSAGALFTDQLVQARSEVLASFLSLSGGVAGSRNPCAGLPVCLKPWARPAQDVPSIVLWGGMCDQCVVIDFEPASQNLEDSLASEGSFFVECVHNCEHAQPPFDAPAGQTVYAGFWDFVYDHPKWLPAGRSPYQAKGLPSSFPSWCSARGKGTAVERTGTCGPPACPQVSTSGPCASTAPAGDSGTD